MIKFTNIPVFPKLDGKFIRLTEPPRSNNGYLYNSYATRNVNFAPTGWKVPESNDYYILQQYLGGIISAGGAMKINDLEYWDSPNTGASNSSGFSAKASGTREEIVGFKDFKQLATFGTSTTPLPNEQEVCILYYDNTTFDTGLSRSAAQGCSVRLLYNGIDAPSNILTDYEGNEYDVIKIGTQYWTKQNWKCNRMANGALIPTITDQTTWGALTTLAKCSYNNDNTLI